MRHKMDARTQLELLNLQRERDRLRNEVKAMAQNNYNQRPEISNLKLDMDMALYHAVKVKDKVTLKGEVIRRINEVMRVELQSYYKYFDTKAIELEEEADYEWHLFTRSHSSQYQRFLKSFIPTRKLHHLSRIKAEKLIEELKALVDIPVVWTGSPQKSSRTVG